MNRHSTPNYSKSLKKRFSSVLSKKKSIPKPAVSIILYIFDFILSTSDIFIPFHPYRKIKIIKDKTLAMHDLYKDIITTKKYNELFDVNNLNILSLLFIENINQNDIKIDKLIVELQNGHTIEITNDNLTNKLKELINNISYLNDYEYNNDSVIDSNLIMICLLINEIYKYFNNNTAHFKSEKNECLLNYYNYNKDLKSTNIFPAESLTKLSINEFTTLLKIFELNLFYKLNKQLPLYQSLKHNLLNYNFPLYLYNDTDRTVLTGSKKTKTRQRSPATRSLSYSQRLPTPLSLSTSKRVPITRSLSYSQRAGSTGSLLTKTKSHKMYGGAVPQNIKLLHLMNQEDFMNNVLKKQKSGITKLTNLSLLNLKNNKEKTYYDSVYSNLIDDLSFVKDKDLRTSIKELLDNYNLKLDNIFNVYKFNDNIKQINFDDDYTYNTKTFMKCNIIFNNNTNVAFGFYDSNFIINIIGLINVILTTLSKFNNFDKLVNKLSSINNEVDINLYKTFFKHYNDIFNNNFNYNQNNGYNLADFIGLFINLMNTYIIKQNKLISVIFLLTSNLIFNKGLDELLNHYNKLNLNNPQSTNS